MLKQIRLIDEVHIPSNLKESATAEKYRYIKNMYDRGKTYVFLNNVSIFGPYPAPEVPWDISEAQKIATYNPEVIKVIRWVMNEIFNKSALFNYKTLNVLIRIATGMLNKCNIPKEIQIMFHDNMVDNLQIESNNVILSELPF